MRDGWTGRTEPDDYGSVCLTGTGARSLGRLSIYCVGDRILLRIWVSDRHVCRHMHYTWASRCSRRYDVHAGTTGSSKVATTRA